MMINFIKILSTWESTDGCDASTLSPGSSVSNPDLTPSAYELGG